MDAKTLPDKTSWYAMRQGDAFMSKLLHEEGFIAFQHAGWLFGNRPFPTRAEADAYLKEWKATGEIPL